MYTKFNQGNKINRVVYTIDILFKFNRLTRNYLSCLGQTHSKLYTPFLGKEKNHTLSLLSEREPGNEVTQSSDTSLYRPKKGLPPPRMNGLHTVVQTKFLSLKQFLFHDGSLNNYLLLCGEAKWTRVMRSEVKGRFLSSTGSGFKPPRHTFPWVFPRGRG